MYNPDNVEDNARADLPHTDATEQARPIPSGQGIDDGCTLLINVDVRLGDGNTPVTIATK